MSELRRIFFSRRMLFTWVIGLFLCGIFFFYECGSAKEITLSEEELQNYIEGYPDFLQSVKDNAENVGMLAVLSDNSDFVRSNISKTLADYSLLEEVVLSAGSNKGIVLYSNFVLGDAIIVAIVLVVLLLFAEEKNKGLSLLVRCTKKGRSGLLLERVGILAVTSLLASFLVTAVCMLLSRGLCGEVVLSRPLQSVPEFSLCAFPITVGEYLLLTILLKAMAAFCAGVFILLLLVWFEAIPAILAGSGMLFAEYLLYTLILGSDRLSGVKLANVIALLRTEIFFKNYYNINLFGHAVGFLTFSVIVISVVAVIMIILATIFSAKCTETCLRFGLINRIKVWCSLHAPNLPLFFWELRKVFFSQRGILVLAAVLYFAASSGLEYRYYSYVDNEREYYYEKYAGVITQEKLTQMQEDYDEIIDLYMQAADEIKYLMANDPENERILTLMQTCYDLSGKAAAVEEIIENATEALAYTERTGVETQLVKPDAYERLLVTDAGTTDKNSMFLLLGIIGIFSGIMAREKECNMTLWLQTLFKGRRALLFRKWGVIALTVPVLVLGVSWAQLYQVQEAVGFNDLGATAQSLELFREIPFPISIGGYLVLIYAIRMLFAFFIGVLVAGISAFSPNRVLCLFVSFVLLVVPMVLAMTGIVNVYSVADLFGFWELW